MPRMTPEVLTELLERPIIATVATIRRGGRPYQVPLWFLWKPVPDSTPAPRVGPSYREGSFWLTGTYSRVWCQHLFANPQTSLCIETSDPVARFVSIDCDAEPVEPQNADIWPISSELAHKYVGSRPGATEADVERFLANMRTEPRLLFRLTPVFWRAIDLTVYQGKRADREHQERVRGV